MKRWAAALLAVALVLTLACGAQAMIDFVRVGYLAAANGPARQMVPEPSSVLALMCGVGAIGYALRRRGK